MDRQDLRQYSDKNNNTYDTYKNNKYYEQIRLEYINGIDDYESENFIVDEECVYCGKHMNDVNEIFVDEFDRYICLECGTEHRVKIVRCRELE